MPLAIVASPSFARAAKKLHPKDKQALDEAVQTIANNPELGEAKRGDLAGVWVVKFKLNNQETLLAYELLPNKQAPEALALLGVGPHENFYRDLKR